PRVLDGLGFGNLCKLRDKGIYGREIPLATSATDEGVTPVKWLRKALTQKRAPEQSQPLGRDSRGADALRRAHGSAGASPYQVFSGISRSVFDREILPCVSQFAAGAAIAEVVTRNGTISARLDFSAIEMSAYVDRYGRALQSPPEREAMPFVCRDCPDREHGLSTTITASPASAWRKLSLVEPDGTPTRRGIIFSLFQAGEGLAIAAALEDPSYSIADLIFDLANIRAGTRFAGEDAPLGGRLGALCQRIYERADYPGYLEMGVPVHYGSGASEVIREVVAAPASRYKFTTESLHSGDIERALIEWRSLLRHIASAPDLEWDRWRELQAAAAHFIEHSTSPAQLDLPPLLAAQQKRWTAQQFA
ncbi:MAG: hypothetical protein ABI795_04610, partial [Chthoniobacterales bacterium]